MNTARHTKTHKEEASMKHSHNFRSLHDIETHNQVILLRVDLNVPTQDGRVTDTARINRLKPTISYLQNQNARIVILSHFGRPKGDNTSGLSLAFLIPTLSKAWNTPVKFCQKTIGEETKTFIDGLKEGEIGLLENIRFHEGEEANDANFVEALSQLGDIYINDAFSCSHRAHASIDGLAKTMPSAAGLLMEEELSALDKALGNPQKPVCAIAGGSKISTKLPVLYNLTEKADFLVLGGGMANTLLFAQGANLGSSLCEKDMKEEALKVLDHAKTHNCEIILPLDMVVVRDLQENADHSISDAHAIPEGKMAVDIGPQTIEHVLEKTKSCKTVVWNGPLGVFEIQPFDTGTNALAKAIAQRTQQGEVVSIAGGGDTVAALENAEVGSHFSYISTAGGAFLEWLEGKSLPGVAALKA